MQVLTASEPVVVYAMSVRADTTGMPDQDNVVISLRFQDGSVGEISYLACGDKFLSKERIEVFGGGQSFVIDDFKLGQHYAGGCSRQRLNLPGKGHQQEVEAFLRSTRNGDPSPISLQSLTLTSAATFAILDSLRTGLPQAVLVKTLELQPQQTIIASSARMSVR